jgi:hypothetical protein
MSDSIGVMTSPDPIAKLQEQGFCVLRGRLPVTLVEACRETFWPVLLAYLNRHGDQPNRGPHRHFLPMPFNPPCFVPEFFFDEEVLRVVRGMMDERIVADQWGCDVPLRGSEYQGVHADYSRPLFAESPDLPLPVYMLVASFGLTPIGEADGPIEIAPGTHRMARAEGLRAVESGAIALKAVPLAVGDVLIRHPWALHRGTPNRTERPRPLASIRYVRRWYADASREVATISRAEWEGLTAEQQGMLRFPVAD